jgi:hypothetical protein
MILNNIGLSTLKLKKFPSVHRVVVKMGKNFQVVLEFSGIIVYANNSEVSDPFSRRV